MDPEEGAVDGGQQRVGDPREAVGGLDEEMGRWARAESLRADEAMDRVAIWLPRLGYALVVGYVVWRIFRLMLGYFAVVLRPFLGAARAETRVGSGPRSGGACPALWAAASPSPPVVAGL